MKKTTLFIILVLGLSWLYTAFIFSDVSRVTYFNLIMYFPCLIALGIRIFERQSLKQISAPFISRKGPRARFGFLFSVVYPLLFVGLCAGVALGLGLAVVDSGAFEKLKYSPSVFSLLITFSLMIGEEYGWRGYLLPELTREHGPLKAPIIVGLIWAAWHGPVLYGLGHVMKTADPIVLCLVQMGAVFVFSFPFAYSYYLAGSILPPMIFHWLWNTYNPRVLGNIYGNTPGLLKGNILYINGEGLMGVVLGLLFVFWFIRKTKNKKLSFLKVLD